MQDYDENRASGRHSVVNLIDHRISQNSKMTVRQRVPTDPREVFLSIVIPAYNEEISCPGRVGPGWFCLLSRVCAVFVGNPLAIEICVEPPRCVA